MYSTVVVVVVKWVIIACELHYCRI